MSKNTAKFILKRHGLSCFSIRELSDLLNDKFMPLPAEVKQAIMVLKTN